ncbi:FMN-dependent NADH-azoreductase [Streptomyces vietnamensis]|uniref:FMN-dependent NADH-azoreductase n=1 Tax=Streptomyces vietnamensis TaxID=362257 RepID=UPI0034486177
MATLLHIDTSFSGENSHSRAVTAAFRAAWEAEHPEGTVIYRDLAAEPVPHLEADVYHADIDAPASALRKRLVEEAEQADVILLGAPMYNYAIPSTLKAWIDHVFLGGRTAMAEKPTLAGKRAVVVASRGGSYREGTPMHGNDYVEDYLRLALGKGFGLDVTFIVPELTAAPRVPAMAELVPLYEASRAESFATAESLAKELAVQLAA